jgi:PAS domain S-box-containing protein
MDADERPVTGGEGALTEKPTGFSQRAEDFFFNADLAMMLFHNAPDAILVINEAGRIELVNGQAELLFGYHRLELETQPVELLVPEGRRVAHEAHRAAYMDEPRMRPMASGLDLQARRKNGTDIPVAINLSPIVTGRGVWVIVTIRRRREDGT